MITLEKAEKISREKIETLHEDFKPKVLAWYEKYLKRSRKVLIYEGLRTMERQAELYNQGRTAPGAIVTKAKAGQSFHNAGLAIDYVPLKEDAKACGMYEADWENGHEYELGSENAKDFEMIALSWETPHLQWNKFATWRDIPKEYFIES